MISTLKSPGIISLSSEHIIILFTGFSTQSAGELNAVLDQLQSLDDELCSQNVGELNAALDQLQCLDEELSVLEESALPTEFYCKLLLEMSCFHYHV